MIQLYKANNLNYDYNGDITLTPVKCELRVEANSIIELDMEHSFDIDGRWKFIDNECVISVPFPRKKNQLFRIYDIEKDMDSIICKARHIFFDLLTETLIDVRPTGKNGQQALSLILNGTGFKGQSDISKISTAYYIRKQIANEVLLSEDENSFINRWGGELDVDNFNVHMNKRVGIDKGVTFEYSKNLLDILDNRNNDEVITRIIPIGFDGITIPENYIDSELINHYPRIKSRVVSFDDVKVKQSESDEDGFDTLEQAQAELRNRCRVLFDNGADKPLVNITIDVANLENTDEYKAFKDLISVGIGDDVTVRHRDLGIDIKTRVIAYSFDCIEEKYIEITIGNYTMNFIDTQNSVINRIDKAINQDGTVRAQEIAGFIDSERAKLGAQREIAQKQHVRAIIFEDLIKDSPTYGCCAIGTAGLEVSNRRNSDDSGWIFDTAITGAGIVADKVVSGSIHSIDGNVELNLDGGYLMFYHNDGSYTKLDLDGLHRYSSTGRRAYHHLTTNIRHMISVSGTSQNFTFNIPNEFVGKIFYITASVASVNVAGDGSIRVLENFEVLAYASDNYTKYTITAYVNGTIMNQFDGDVRYVGKSTSGVLNVVVTITA